MLEALGSVCSFILTDLVNRPVILTLRKWRQGDLELKVILTYTASLKLAWTTLDSLFFGFLFLFLFF